MKNFVLVLSLLILVCSCGTPQVAEKSNSDINIQKAPSELAVQYEKLTSYVSYLKFEKINDQFLEDMNFNEGKLILEMKNPF